MDIEEEFKEENIEKNEKNKKEIQIKLNNNQIKRKNNSDFDNQDIPEKKLNPINKKVKIDNENNSSDKEELYISKNKPDLITNEIPYQGKKEPKKIKKTRKVKRIKTYKDEDGYDVTSEIMEDEEYWTDEKSEANSIGKSFKNNLNINKASAPSVVKKPTNQNKKGAVNQKSLESFFKK